MSIEKNLIINSSNWVGCPYTPRDWQAEALDVVLLALHERRQGLVRAVMGAGKSKLMAEVVASIHPDRHGVIVVTAPTRKLVEQLHATLAKRISTMTRNVGQTLGCWYSDKKHLRPITVACHNSLPTLFEAMVEGGKHCALWIADEAHRTNAAWCTDFFARCADKWGAPLGLGFSATPYLSDHNDTLALFESELYSYSWQRALEDGVIVRWKVQHYDGGAGEGASLNDVCIEMIKKYKREWPDHPGLVNAASRLDAEDFAGLLSGEGIRAVAVHSGLSSGANDRTLASLKRGDLDAIVHVNMLSEGVDIPELRWLCMRRPVQSRVRFAQEVGRVLRAAPNKMYATIMDPLDLFSGLRLSYGAALSNGIDPDDLRAQITNINQLDELDITDALAEQLELAGVPGAPVGMMALLAARGAMPKIMKPTKSYLRRMHMAISTLFPGKDAIKATSWREDEPSEKAIAFLTKLSGVVFDSKAKKIPIRHRRMLQFACSHPENWVAGMVSDTIDILIHLEKNGWDNRLEILTSGGTLPAAEQGAEDQ